MWDNLFKTVRVVTVFVLGLTSPVVVHVLHVAYVALVSGKEAAVSSWLTSYPWNVYAGVGFALALICIVWHAWRQSKKDLIVEQKRNDAIKQAVKEGIKEAITELKEYGFVNHNEPEDTDVNQ